MNFSPTTVQGLLFSTDRYTTESAKEWALRHGFLAGAVDQTRAFIHLRQRPPSEFEKGTIRTITFGKGIEARIGHLLMKGKGTMPDRTIRLVTSHHAKSGSSAHTRHKRIIGIENQYRKLAENVKAYVGRAKECRRKARSEKDRALKRILNEEARIFTKLAREENLKIKVVLAELKGR